MGNPILNARGKSDALVPFRYITQGPVALYFTRDPQYAQVMQDAEKTMLPFVAMNPTRGLLLAGEGFESIQRSRSGCTKTSTTLSLVVKPFSYLDQVAKEWLDNGGIRCAPSSRRKSPHRASALSPG